MQEKVQCSPEQNLSNTTGVSILPQFYKIPKNSSNLATRLSSESGPDHVKKCFPNKTISWETSASDRNQQREGLTSYFMVKKPSPPMPSSAKAWTIGHFSTMNMSKICRWPAKQAQQHPPINPGTSEFLGFTQSLNYLIFVQLRISKRKIFFCAGGEFRSSSTP